ncbi:hypothetical protein AWN76_011380 [Rhodothermaceae bacterium RA]|nr:hypothetical protein AWN76_011380 [Rhodothermaceae bacterium RA]
MRADRRRSYIARHGPPGPSPSRRPHALEDRTRLNGLFRVFCCGAAWRDVPERFGPWQTVWTLARVP